MKFPKGTHPDVGGFLASYKPLQGTEAAKKKALTPHHPLKHELS